ncbi:hypothetical protein GE115_07000 [Agromyces sp. CFH 90414]|uniref:Cardiolipin synthase N-terminal domain-containing protein n=1 Tax=Agromyces agglutinans TaxID=2662258 RepID=A0A6I2FF04_9MICO|nr:PLD nuclease N-terminal domain-containing protein [Agromyces agglutinans]MRG59618.1 hypothetical protein [Agromyces agglutinans]
MLVRLVPIAVVVVVGVMVYAIVDCALIDRMRIRGLARGWWIAIILIPVLGPVLWFTIGRGPADRATRGRSRGPIAPDDDTEFLRGLERDAQQEDRIRRLEQELADLDEPTDDADTGPADGDGATHDHRRPDAPDNGDSGSSGRPNG